MTLFDRVSELSKKQGLSIFDLSNKLGLSRNAVYSWKTSSPKADTLDKVADYFNVSTDYLLGRTDNPNSIESKTDSYEDELLMMFRRGESEVPEEKKELYRKQVTDLMGFISDTMKELDEDNKNK